MGCGIWLERKIRIGEGKGEGIGIGVGGLKGEKAGGCARCGGFDGEGRGEERECGR